MPLFNKFPYTNFHELNLDWILEQIPLFQKMRDETEGFRNETEELKHGTEHLRDETKVLHDDTKDLHDNVVEEHKQITTEITQAKNDITNTVNTGKNEINTLVTNGTQQIDTLITTGKQDINTLVDSSKSAITTLSDTSKQEITTLTNNGKALIDSAVTTGTSSISDAVSNGITSITGEKDKALTAITSSKDSAINAIETQENSTLQAVSGEGAKQVKAVGDEGNAKIAEITTKGDEYTTTMTDLFTNTKYHAENAKASETKAQEYAETAKTLKPLYWGGDLENLHQTLDVKAECENAVNKASITRWFNLLILKNANNSPDNTKEWQCKITPVTSAKANLLAWNSDGSMYVGTYDSAVTDITWMNTVNLDEIHGEIVDSDAELQKQITKNKNDLIAIDNKVSGLATVATTGSYNDLADKPNIPEIPTSVGTWGKKISNVKTYDSVYEGIESGDGVFIVNASTTSLAPNKTEAFIYMCQEKPEGQHFIIATSLTLGESDMYFSSFNRFTQSPFTIGWNKVPTNRDIQSLYNYVNVHKINANSITAIRPSGQTIGGTLIANRTGSGSLTLHGQITTKITHADTLSTQLSVNIPMDGTSFLFGSTYGTVWTGTGVPIYALFTYKNSSISYLKLQIDLFQTEGTDLSILRFNTQLQ